ncbi:MAG: zinc-binding dehydrogenase [Deltaproteobacteria bacterium]|nr:MAG: zinc-binding dehydrogenase [Deltaproteobacteria bacterium]
MKGVVFVGDGEVEVRDFDVPVPGQGEVLVEMKASGLCGSDLPWLRKTQKELSELPYMNPMGHEPCGVIAALGPGVTGLEVGQRVIVYHYKGCGRCKYCRIGYEQYCVHGHRYYGQSTAKGLGGGHEDFMVAADRVCLNLPDELSYEAGAAIGCGTGTAYSAIKLLRVSGFDTIAVFGQGPVGLSATMIAAGMGARVIAIDIIPYRLELAKKLGAAETINAAETDPVEALKELTQGEGVDAAIECSGKPPVRVQALNSAKLFGRVCFVGGGGGLTIDEMNLQVIRRQLKIFGSQTFPVGMLEEIGNWIVKKNLPIEDLITHRFTIDQAQEAYEVFIGGQTGKVVLVWK